MAIFHFEIRPIKRFAGQQATGAAAYRAGERILDERTGDLHNHSRRRDVRHAEIFLPSQFDESPMEWARARASLWNHAEAAEKRRDARVAREYQVALPPELTADQRLALARSFSRELAQRYGVAVDLAVHDPKPGRDSQNFHAHLLSTTREVTSTGLGVKAGLDMQSVARARQGLPGHSEEYTTLRERWATLTNEALRDANIEARVDHRSLAAQGVDRKPLLKIPIEFYRLESRGMPRELAEGLRRDYRARVAAYLERSAERPPVEQATRQREHATPQPEQVTSNHEQATLQREHASPKREHDPVDSRNVDEIRRRAVQRWLRMRSKEAESSLETGAGSEATTTRELDDNLGK